MVFYLCSTVINIILQIPYWVPLLVRAWNVLVQVNVSNDKKVSMVLTCLSAYCYTILMHLVMVTAEIHGRNWHKYWFLHAIFLTFSRRDFDLKWGSLKWNLLMYRIFGWVGCTKLFVKQGSLFANFYTHYLENLWSGACQNHVFVTIGAMQVQKNKDSVVAVYQ